MDWVEILWSKRVLHRTKSLSSQAMKATILATYCEISMMLAADVVKMGQLSQNFSGSQESLD